MLNSARYKVGLTNNIGRMGKTSAPTFESVADGGSQTACALSAAADATTTRASIPRSGLTAPGGLIDAAQRTAFCRQLLNGPHPMAALSRNHR